MEWFDHESINALKDIEDDDTGIKKHGPDENDLNESQSTDSFNASSGGSNGSEKKDTCTQKMALDDIFRSLAVDSEPGTGDDIGAIGHDAQAHSTNNAITSNNYDSMIFDEQTQATERSFKSQRSTKSGGSSYSYATHESGLSLTEQLEKLCKDDEAALAAADALLDEENSASASSWLPWGRKKGTGTSIHTRSSNGTKEKSLNSAEGALKDDDEDHINLDDPLDKSHSSEHYELLGLDEEGLVARTGLNDEHPNQALFDIIEQSFDSIDLFHVKELKRSVNVMELKLCFAVYVYVFTPPTPTAFATQYNHSIDNDLREKYFRTKQSEKGGKKKWFKWGSRKENDLPSCTITSEKNQQNEDNGKFTYEVVPLNIVFSLWEEVLRLVGLKMSTLRSNVKRNVLNYVKEILVDLGLLDSSIIDLSEDVGEVGHDSLPHKASLECEFIAARQAINGEYGEYLRRTYKFIKECLEGHQKMIFRSAAKMSDEEDRSMRDYCSGMLPYTLLKSHEFVKAEAKLCDYNFVRKRLDHFGLLEGTTIQVTDIEVMIEQNQISSQGENALKVEKFLKKSYDTLKSCVDDQDFEADCLLCEEAGKALHLMAVSFMSLGSDLEGLKYLTDALRYKELVRSPLDNDIGSISLSDTYQCIGNSHRALGDFDSALSHYKQALLMRCKLLDDDDVWIAESLQSMGSALCEVGETVEARTLLEKALRIRKSNHGESHESIAETEEWIGNVLREQGDLHQALDFFYSALAFKKKHLGLDHEEVGNIMFSLAMTLDNAKDFDNSITHFKEALRVRDMVYGRGLVVADTYLCLGRAYLKRSQHSDAFENLQESIVIREELLQRNESISSNLNFIVEVNKPNDDVALQYTKLVECFEAFIPLYGRLYNDSKVAAKYLQSMGESYFNILDYENAMSSFQAAFDEGDQGTATELKQKIGQLYILKGNYLEAQKYLIQCLTIEKAIVGENCPSLFPTIFYLGVTLHNMKKHDNSLAILLKGAELLENADGDLDNKRVYAKFWIGKEYFALRDYTSAIEYFLQVLAWYKQLNQKRDIRVVIKTLDALGKCHLARGHLRLALKSFKGEIQLFETKGHTTKNLDYAEAYCSTGDVHSKMQAYADAQKCFEKALTAIPPGCNKEVASTLFSLGEVNMKEGRYQEAKEILIGAHKMFEESVGAHHSKTVSAAFKLAQLHDEMKEYKSAMAFYHICLSSQELKGEKINENVGIGTILFLMGKNSFSQSVFDDALTFLERALAVKKKELKPNDVHNAPIFYELAKCYFACGTVDKAILCYKEAHRIWKSHKDLNQAGNASFELATLFEEQEQNILAVKSYEECLDLFNVSNTLRPQLHYRLGTLHTIINNTAEAIAHFLKYIEDLGTDLSGDETYLFSLRSLAQLYSAGGEFEKSFSIYNELIELIEINDNPNQDALAHIYHEEGKVHFKLDNYDGALRNLQTSISIRKAMENDEINYGEIGVLLLDLTKVYEAKGDLNSASNSLLEALFIHKLVRNDNNRIAALMELARIYEKMDNMGEAKECYEDCIKIQKTLPTNAEIAVATTLFKFGSLLGRMNEEDRALETFQMALKIQESAGSHDHLPTLQKIGEIYMRKSMYKEALETLVKTIPQWQDDKLEERADCNRNIGVIHVAREEYESAEPYLQDALAFYAKCSISDERRSSALHLYGRSLCMTSKFSLAKETILEAMTLREVAPGPGSIEYAQSLTCLGEVEFGQNQLSEALKNLKRALSIYRSFDEGAPWECIRIQTLISRIFYLQEDFENARRAVETCQLKMEENFPNDVDMRSDLLLLKGKVLSSQNDLNGAYDQFKRCLSARKRDGKEKYSVLEVLLEIGDVLFKQEQYKNCVMYYHEASRIKKRLGMELPVSTQNQVGISYIQIGKFDEAIRVFKEIRCLSLNSSKNLDDRQGELATQAYYLGQAYDGLKQKNEALASYIEAIASFGLFQSNEKKDNVILASAMHNAGIILIENESAIERGTEMFESALDLRRKHLNRFSVDTAHTLYQFAKILNLSESEEKIVNMFTEAETIYNRHQRYEEQASCLSELGHLTLSRDMKKSFVYYKKAWAIYSAHELERHCEAANILFGIGFIHNQQLRSQQSADVLKECLKIRIREEGKSSLNVGKTCEQLGSCLLSLGQHEDALKLYVTSLEIYRDYFGEDNAACARVMLDIATLYSYKQQFDHALVQLTACLDFMESEHGKESEEVASVLLRIGQLHDMRVDNDEALRCVSKALEIRIKLYTKSDLRVAETYLICGKVLEDWGDIDEAMDCFQNALMIFQLKKGVEDSQVAIVHDQIAGILVEKGDYDAAIESYNEALSIYQVQHGERSSQVGHTLRNLGAIFDHKQDFQTSYKYFMDSLKILRQSLGDDDLSVGLVLNNIGIILARQKKYRKAIDLCTVALRIRRSQLSKNHSEIADTLINLANIMDDCNKDDQALKFYKEALSIYRANFGDETEDIANTLRSIGYINIRQGDIADAIAHLSESLRIFRMKQGAESLDVATVLYHLGRIYGKKAEYEKALSCFKESHRIREILLPSNHRELSDTERFVEAIRRKIES